MYRGRRQEVFLRAYRIECDVISWTCDPREYSEDRSHILASAPRLRGSDLNSRYLRPLTMLWPVEAPAEQLIGSLSLDIHVSFIDLLRVAEPEDGPKHAAVHT